MKTRQTLMQVPVDRLRRHPANVRETVGDVEELARSIAEHGILQPLVLTEDPDEQGALRILAGHRRLAAALRAGMTSVPCVVRHQLGGDATEQLVVMLVENCQRRDLSPMEKAEAYGALRNRGLTQSEIARRTGMHVSTINHYLTLLDLDDDTQEAVSTGEVNSTDAIAAVREARQEERRERSAPERGRPVVVEPAHFTSMHPLANRVQLVCDHSRRPRIHGTQGVGCGQCWERVIRESERGLEAEPSRAEPSRAEPSRAEPSRAEPSRAEPSRAEPRTFDEAVVLRRLDGDRDVHMRKPERIEIVRRARERGWSETEIEERTGVLNPARYARELREEAS